ncbi:MAG TPA: TetR/AcrR family transcriptional regulator [Acidimicrobiales bacterium]|nr:TetR/AcrR family transcriptional regulator [Acidimicrobiales bacterium]
MQGKVAQRREARVAGIVESAWELARQNGIAGISLHALAREVGIRQPSLYEYFDSKNALYDAMFADGNRKLLERLDSLKLPGKPRVAIRQWMKAFTDFGLEDPARFELLFQRHVPGFTPSAESFSLAEEVLGRGTSLTRAAGVTRQGDIDCIVAVVAGLMEAQLSNDPGGDRWIRHLDRLVDLVIDDALAATTTN